jgi:cation diffusion facilitator family transporter
MSNASPALPRFDRLTWAAIGAIVVALVVMGIKWLAYRLTGSVAFYSDALESIVNVVTAIATLVAVRIGARPPDRNHPFGHQKVEYFAAVLEGALVIVAALAILVEAGHALQSGGHIVEAKLGLALNGLATIINGAWATWLINRGRAWRSPALEADGRHSMADVVTSCGVFAGVALAAMTGWSILDPLMAIVVASHVLHTGWELTRQSMAGLLDEAASPDIQGKIREAIMANGGGALQAHDIRTRYSGRVTFIEFHLVVPGAMSVAEAHVICDRLEDAIEAAIPDAQVSIHVEPEEKAKARGAIEL